MLAILSNLVWGVVQFYAWTVGLGLVVLFTILVVEGVVDLIRDRRSWRPSRSSLPRINA